MTGGTSGHIGGVERQMSSTARWLTKQGYSVSLLTWDDGQLGDEIIDGVHVIKVCQRDVGLPGLRFFHPRWTRLNHAMARADADLYYQNCAEYVTGQVALWCRRHNRRFVYSVASDPECDVALPEMKTKRERVLYRMGLHRADHIIVQTRTQQKMLREGFNLHSVVIPIPCWDVVDTSIEPKQSQMLSTRILWVGRICEPKGPHRFLELAQACPDLHFDFVGPSDGTAYSQAVLWSARSIKNVTVHGAVTRNRMPAFYKQAACLCCTSDYEGFPNTFLEAWSYGLPIVSTFDPDGLIVRLNLGRTASDIVGLEASIRALLNAPKDWQIASHNAREYYKTNHTVEVVMPQFERLFLNVLAAGRKR
jgi:glycosyltransferase involved in cell wall biosynthesis